MLAIALGTVLTIVVTAAVTRSGVVDRLFPDDPVSCPRTSTSLQPGAPTPSEDATVVHDGEAPGRNGNVVGFKICRDLAADAASEFWYFGTSPGPSTNLVPATRVRVDPPRYETAVSEATFYFVDCGTNTFGYVTDAENASLFDDSVC